MNIIGHETVRENINVIYIPARARLETKDQIRDIGNSTKPRNPHRPNSMACQHRFSSFQQHKPLADIELRSKHQPSRKHYGGSHP